MRLLFEIDTKDYKKNGTVFSRPSARSIIIRSGRIAMVHSLKYDYYKFPGGGIDNGETKEQALIRETLEESGLRVIPESIREYGYVHRIQKGEKEDIFVQDNYYFLCDADDEIGSQDLDDYESDERFTLEFVEPEKVITTNLGKQFAPIYQVMAKRESEVIRMLMDEGYFG